MPARNPQARLDPRDPFFSLQRTVPSYFDGIMGGGVPRSLDVGDLVGAYNLEFHNALADRGVIKALKDATAADGKPLVMISGTSTVSAGAAKPNIGIPRTFFLDSNGLPKEAVTADGRRYQTIDHWALRDWKFASRDAQGNPILLRGDFVVHPDHYRFLKNELGKSALRDPEGPLGNFAKATGGLLRGVGFLKASKLASATFHMATLAEHSMFHAVAGQPTADRLALAWPSTRGVEINPARNAKLARLMRAGMELGFGGGRELFEEGLASHGGLWGKVPGLGDVLTEISDFCFKRYLPALKVKTGAVVLDANLKRYAGKLSEEQIYELTAQQMNAAFGAQNWRLLGTNKTLLDVSRLMFLAPDFLLSRAKVVGQAFKPYNREQTLFLLAQGGLAYVLARIVNQLISGDPHDEPENALRIVVNGRSYGARLIAQDAIESLRHPVEFGAGRFSPLPRIGIETVTQRDMRTGVRKEVPFETSSKGLRAAEVAATAAAEWFVPIGGEAFVPGRPPRSWSSPCTRASNNT